MLTQKRFSWLGSLVLTALLAVGCGHSKSNPQLTAESAMAGSWSLEGISCNGQDSSVDPLLTQGVASFEMTFDNATGSRVWKVGGCTLTVPLTSISYTSDQLTITEGAASCQEAKSGDCAAFTAQCQAQGDSLSYPYTLNSDTMTLVIAPNPAYEDPCNSKWADQVTYNLNKLQ